MQALLGCTVAHRARQQRLVNELRRVLLGRPNLRARTAAKGRFGKTLKTRKSALAACQLHARARVRACAFECVLVCVCVCVGACVGHTSTSSRAAARRTHEQPSDEEPEGRVEQPLQRHVADRQDHFAHHPPVLVAPHLRQVQSSPVQSSPVGEARLEPARKIRRGNFLKCGAETSSRAM